MLSSINQVLLQFHPHPSSFPFQPSDASLSTMPPWGLDTHLPREDQKIMPAGNLKLYEKKKTKKIGIRFRRKKNWKNTRSFFFFFFCSKWERESSKIKNNFWGLEEKEWEKEARTSDSTEELLREQRHRAWGRNGRTPGEREGLREETCPFPTWDQTPGKLQVTLHASSRGSEVKACPMWTVRTWPHPWTALWSIQWLQAGAETAGEQWAAHPRGSEFLQQHSRPWDAISPD